MLTGIVFLVTSIFLRDWLQFIFSLACFCFGAYVALVVEKGSSSQGSPYAQLTLFALGAAAMSIGVLAFLWLVEKMTQPHANWFFSIIGLVVAPMIILMGIAMCLCAIFSQRNAHAWLMYLVTEPSRYILPIGEIPPQDRVRPSRLPPTDKE